jgi:hypothetical protein
VACEHFAFDDGRLCLGKEAPGGKIPQDALRRNGGGECGGMMKAAPAYAAESRQIDLILTQSHASSERVQV